MRKLLLSIVFAALLAGCESHVAVCGSDGIVYDQKYVTVGQDQVTQMDGQTCTVNKDGSFTVRYSGQSTSDDDN